MKLYDLGHVPWLDSQLLYHALARVGEEGLFILAPSEPYVCIGYHQDLEQEVDIAQCQQQGLPIFRREVGGGAVYLDGNQLFYQLILNKDNPLAQGDKPTFYQRLLEPVVQAYGDLGVPSRYRPINDIITTEGRKIAGTGAASIADSVVLVGNLMADFDYETMARVLRVPDEKYRDKVFKSMRENLTTLKRETEHAFTWEELAPPLIRRYEAVLGELVPSTVPQAVRDEAKRLESTFLSEEWLYKRGKRLPARDVRIASDVNVVQRLHKAPGGLLRATMVVKEAHLSDVSLSGDLFCYPAEALSELESALEGVPTANVQQAVAQFYASHPIETPGVTVDDWCRVLAG